MMMMMMKLIIWIVTMTMMILKGRYDVVCPLTSAWELHKALPHSELKMSNTYFFLFITIYLTSTGLQ